MSWWPTQDLDYAVLSEPVPEPGGLALVVGGLLALGFGVVRPGNANRACPGKGVGERGRIPRVSDSRPRKSDVMKRSALGISWLRALGHSGLALLLSACGDSNGSTAPSTTLPSDRFILEFESRIATEVTASRVTVTTNSRVQGQVALASTPQANQFSMSQGDLTSESFAYTVSPSGNCSFTTSTTNGVLTVVRSERRPEQREGRPGRSPAIEHSA
jgi:hypothetical protein